MSTLDPREVILAVKERINDQYLYTEMERRNFKLKLMRTYRQIKSDFSMEKYLSLPSHLHSALAKFSHSLAIETGCYIRPLITTRETTVPSVQGYGR